jgi:hypothetical protein
MIAEAGKSKGKRAWLSAGKVWIYAIACCSGSFGTLRLKVWAKRQF